MSWRGRGVQAGTQPAARGTNPTKCQKCLQLGHWTFECKNQPTYISRPTRTQQLLNPKVRAATPRAHPARRYTGCDAVY
jgi:hypothetical protein